MSEQGAEAVQDGQGVQDETAIRQAWAELETAVALFAGHRSVEAMLKAAVVDGKPLTAGEQQHFTAAYLEAAKEGASLPEVPKEVPHLRQIQSSRGVLAGQVLAAILHNCGENAIYEMVKGCPEGVARLVEVSLTLARALMERVQDQNQRELEGLLALYQDRGAYVQARAEARVRRLRETGGE